MPISDNVIAQDHNEEERKRTHIPRTLVVYCPGTGTGRMYNSVLKSIITSYIESARLKNLEILGLLENLQPHELKALLPVLLETLELGDLDPELFEQLENVSLLEMDGPGGESGEENSVAAPKSHEWLPDILDEVGGLIAGTGITANLRKFEEHLNQLKQEGKLPSKIVLGGHSRGLYSVQMANIAARICPDIEIELFLIDPVVGPMDKFISSSDYPWEDKFIIPKQVKKCCVFYSTTENRMPFKGVVTPDKFIIESKEMVFISAPVALTHGQINGVYEDQHLIANNKAEGMKKYDENQSIRNAMEAVIRSVMGKGFISAENKSTLLQQLQDPSRSEQRKELRFYRVQNWENLADPGLREIFMYMERQEFSSVKALSRVASTLLLANNEPSTAAYKKSLHQNPLVKAIVAELAKDISAYEKINNIHDLCDKAKQQSTISAVVALAASIKQLIATPFAVPTGNELIRLQALCEENDMEFKQIQAISKTEFAEKTIVTQSNETTSSDCRETFTKLCSTVTISSMQQPKMASSQIDSNIRQQAQQQMKEYKKLLPRMIECFQNTKKEIMRILNKFIVSATKKLCVATSEKFEPMIESNSLVKAANVIDQALAPAFTLR